VTALAKILHLLLLAAPTPSPYDAEIAAAVLDVESVHYVPPALVKAIIRCESNFNPQAISQAGAIGLMQVMPFNARRAGITPGELWVPSRNILAGVRLIAVLLKHYNGDLISVLVAYNARPRKMFAPIPQNGETPRYLSAVLKYYQTYLGASPSSGEIRP
jgi:soluble lytic murein transglycosylase-like protein